jgi:hypothetical protein
MVKVSNYENTLAYYLEVEIIMFLELETFTLV